MPYVSLIPNSFRDLMEAQSLMSKVGINSYTVKRINSMQWAVGSEKSKV